DRPADGNGPARRAPRTAAARGAHRGGRPQPAAMGFVNLDGAYPLALVVAAGLAGLGADLLYALLRPTPARPVAWRLFAAAVPAPFYAGSFLALIATEGLAWSVHVWTGSIALAGLGGWLLSYLLLPPRSVSLAEGGSAAWRSRRRALELELDEG